MLPLLLLRWLARPLAWLLALAALAVAAARFYRHLVPGSPSDSATIALNVSVGIALLIGTAACLAVRRGDLAPDVSRLEGSTTHGSARWSSPREEPTATEGLVIGRPAGPPGARLLRYRGDGHLLTLAPTGAGKGVGCVIPNLLTYPGSVIVTDPKGENFAITARRRRALGHRVIALDPFGLVGGSGAFNPLEALDPRHPAAVDDAAALADLMLLREPRETGENVFWSEEAKALLAGLILHAATDPSPERRTLRTVWEYLSLPPRAMTQLWTQMAQSPAAGGAVARAAARVRQKGDRVRSGILAQAQSQAHFLESDRIARVLQQSTFSFEELTTTRLSLFLVLPPDRIDSCRRWLRLLVGCALQAVVRSRTPRPAPEERVLFLLDEFPALGAMPPLERAVALARGYGATCWLLAQDLAQLRALYPSTWSTFIANAGVVQAFGTNDVETATYVSDMLGTTTVRSTSVTRSRRGMGGFLQRADCRDSCTVTERERRLLSPDEVRGLASTTMLLLMPGRDPVRARRLDYRSDREFAGMCEGAGARTPDP